MKKLLIILVIALLAGCATKEAVSNLNLDFEYFEKEMPTGWNISGGSNYILAIDSTHVKRGKYSASLEFKEGNPDFKAWGFALPGDYPGNKITLTGYIKTENVTDGYAGLWMRIDPSIAFDNMSKNGVNGTTDWTKYEVTLDMNPEKTKQIVVGGLLVGKGKMWIDDLRVTIDGKDIHSLKHLEKKVFPADQDKEFDTGSGIANISVGPIQIENLKTLGLIWGFLKYYHPNIAKGEYNWDYELFRILPKVVDSEDKVNRDEILVKWIESLGKFSEVSEVETNLFDTKFQPDLDWIMNSNFSA
ncbi:MAG TPA: hypothetical protein VN763_05925, partial [Saprospiraceae bacterium]|nr:hypothetical protein [Saprospiraceae bacterium]